ncbi:hypothetical protein V8C86DRAFT_3027330 [Haematococcus lacustris]
MAAPSGAAHLAHLVDDAPSDAASRTQRIKVKTHGVAALLTKFKASKAVRKNYRAMVDLKLKKVMIAQAQSSSAVPKQKAKRLSPQQQRLIDRFFAMCGYTSGVPYVVCKNQRLKRAIVEARVYTLSPMRLETTKDTLYEETRLEKDDQLKELLQVSPLLQL